MVQPEKENGRGEVGTGYGKLAADRSRKGGDAVADGSDYETL